MAIFCARLITCQWQPCYALAWHTVNLSSQYDLLILIVRTTKKGRPG